ncbi:MAG: type II toxin-antitoxin system VapC family toxin [Burkholderiales bacterium]
MTTPLLVDTGPLVALLSERDRHHEWAKQAFAGSATPARTCEAVLSEAWYLLRLTRRGQPALLELVERGLISIDFALASELVAVRRLVTRYRDRPMALADACLVRMAELYDEATVLTLDADFTIYRKNGRQVIPLIAPFA